MMLMNKRGESFYFFFKFLFFLCLIKLEPIMARGCDKCLGWVPNEKVVD